MRLIPKKTRVGLELFRGITLTDLAIFAVATAFLLLVITSGLPGRGYIALGILLICAVLAMRMDGEPTYIYLLHILRHYVSKHSFARSYTDEMLKEMQSEEGRAAAFEKTFGKKAKKTANAAQSAQSALSKKELARREKEKKARRAQEDKILKSKTATEEEKKAIRDRRREEYVESARRLAEIKDAAADRSPMEEIIAFTDIHDDVIDYAKSYYGTAIEIPPVEFRFFSEYRRVNSVENGVGRILRALNSEYGANIVKIERPVNYDSYLDNEYRKMDELRSAFENGSINESEMQSRIEVLYDRINDLRNLCYDQKVVTPYYYVVLFNADLQQLEIQTANALEALYSAELSPRRLNTKELAVFLKYTNQIDFDEREVENLDPRDYAKWAMPEIVDMTPRTVQVNHIITHNLCVSEYPTLVDDAWMAGVMSIPATKVVIKCTPMDRTKVLRSIDHSLQELRGQYMATGVDSKRMELETHIDTLATLLAMLQGDNETLVCCNTYVTAYDINRTRLTPSIVQPPISSRSNISEMKKTVRRIYREAGIRLNPMEFNQLDGFIGSQISGYDPLRRAGRGIPSNSVSAAYPWIYAYVSDKNGVKLGSSDGVPVFIDFFRRDSERVNSNMVIVGKSGSGKSYATKSILTNLAADDAKIFILDPENEYSELAKNLHGKFINVGNAQYGRLNPFHIITALSDDEQEDDTSGDSYATHLQFLEEFFRQILPDCDKDALEYLNSMVDRTYGQKGITEDTDLSRLRPQDYPIFDDLYDTILEEFQSTQNDYIRTMLRTLMNYVSKFSTGGRNAVIWNGPSSVTTEENFTVFNFQSLLANRNGSVANAQMLLVLKYIDNEIIKNRDYNIKYHANRKIVVVIDEAHVFIDTKYPVALDFMFQLAKRIRKYNGMQIVITQNIKDFVGSEEIARKSTAIINACQYSLIFSLAPNDMDDLCLLYEKAGGINENEQEQIVSAPRGNAFTIMSPQSRSSFKVEVPDGVREMFESREFVSSYFVGEKGAENWADFMGDSLQKREENMVLAVDEEENAPEEKLSHMVFEEISEDEYAADLQAKQQRAAAKNSAAVLERTAEASSPRINLQPAVAAAMDPGNVVAPIAPQVIVQTPAVSPDMERMVSELSRVVENLTQFSYDSILARVKAEMESMMPASAAAPTTAVSTPADEDLFSSESLGVDLSDEELFGDEMASESPAEKSVALGSIFNEDAMAEATRLAQEEQKSRTDEPDELDELDELLGSLDEEETEETEDDELMSELFDAMEDTSGITAIDMMAVYGDTVISVSLEELASYIVAHKNEL